MLVVTRYIPGKLQIINNYCITYRDLGRELGREFVYLLIVIKCRWIYDEEIGQMTGRSIYRT